MAGDSSINNASRENPAASLFQRAHQRIVTLQRIDEQLAALVEQRRRAQDELKGLQSQINEEFDRLTKLNADLPASMMSAGASAISVSTFVGANGNGRARELAESDAA